MPLIKRHAAATEPAVEPEPELAVLLADIASSDPDERRAAARWLGNYPETAAVLSAAAAAETSESVREALFTALIRIGTKPAADALVPLLQSEDAALRNAAIDALKTMPGPAAECIDEILTGNVDVRIFGVEILGALAHPDRASRLVRVIETEPELNVCAAAVDALMECGDAAAIGPLVRLRERFLDEPFLEFSIQAALARIGTF